MILGDAPAPTTIKRSSADDATLKKETIDSSCSAGMIGASSSERSTKLMRVEAVAQGLWDGARDHPDRAC